MNPVEIEDDIRTLELMLYGGSPLRRDVLFGRDEMGHFDAVKSRAPEVFPVPFDRSAAPETVVECYVISEDGKMRVEAPKPTEGK